MTRGDDALASLDSANRVPAVPCQPVDWLQLALRRDEQLAGRIVCSFYLFISSKNRVACAISSPVCTTVAGGGAQKKPRRTCIVTACGERHRGRTRGALRLLMGSPDGAPFASIRHDPSIAASQLSGNPSCARRGNSSHTRVHGTGVNGDVRRLNSRIHLRLG